MNLKRIFGAILTVLGIGSLLYGAILFTNSTTDGTRDVKILVTYVTLGLLFFISGISLIKMTKDEA